MRRRIYIDNSVIGGYFDDEFEYETKKFFERIKNNEFQIYFSNINEAELTLAPDHIVAVKEMIPTDCLTPVELDDESRNLGDTYIKEGILTTKSLNDAYHIAIASVNRLDLLVSWNFKHIVNYDKIEMFNSVNLKSGYPEIDIRTSRELVKYES